MTTETTSLLDTLADRAYATLQSKSRAERAEAIAELPHTERLAFLLCNFISQVLNGGHRQYVDNGYAVRLNATLEAVRMIGTVNSAKIAAGLASLAPHVDQDAEEQGCLGDYWVREDSRRGYFADDDEEDGESDDEFSVGEQLAEELDTPFYDISDAWREEIEAWLAAGAPDRSSAIVPAPKASPTPSDGGIRYPQVTVRLLGRDGNAFAIIGNVAAALRQHGVSREEIKAFERQATSGSYDQLLQTVMGWVNVR